MVKEFSKLKVAIISDDLTRTSLEHECNIKNITSFNYKFILNYWEPDFLLVESCWNGFKDRWKYKIAAYPNKRRRNNKALKAIIQYAQSKNVPTVFWNKEDGVHFDRFIESAIFFDHIFTTDSNMISKYREICTETKTVESLPFAINPKIHFPQDIKRDDKFCFVGSYRADLHKDRQLNQSMLLEPALKYGLDIYDRNSDRKSNIFRFPEKYQDNIKNRVPYEETGNVYNNYIGCLNINTVTDSPTMFSRRVVEVMACKTPLITTNSLAIEALFKDYVFTIENAVQAGNVMRKLSLGLDRNTQERLDAGHDLIMKEYTYTTWLRKIMNTIK